MMMLIASFSGKVYSFRAQENRKKRKQEKLKEWLYRVSTQRFSNQRI